MDKIKIGHRIWTIKNVDIVEGNDNIEGIVRPSTGEIEIRNDLDGDEKTITLLHEVFHAIEYYTGHDLKEGQIMALSNMLFCVMRENPELCAEIMGEQ